MILNCNSCNKKFVVPDQAITSSGRLVQCSACGNKWKQFPIKSEPKSIIKNINENTKKITKTTIPKKNKIKKAKKIDLYSPEYLAKKHGIVIKEVENNTFVNKKNKISFGFYNSLIVLIVFFIFISRGIYFFQDFIVKSFPISEFYLNYFFESIRNIFEILKSLIINY